jgi:hypothetical protein
MKRLLLIALFALLAVPMFAQTQELPETSGNAFVRLCSAMDKALDKEKITEGAYVVACLEYIQGFTHGVDYEVAFVQGKTKRIVPAPFCLPDDVENGQGVRILLKYIRDNPEEANKPTAILIMKALGKAYPCPTPLFSLSEIQSRTGGLTS